LVPGFAAEMSGNGSDGKSSRDPQSDLVEIFMHVAGCDSFMLRRVRQDVTTLGSPSRRTFDVKQKGSCLVKETCPTNCGEGKGP
jgi:hypothetical protein